MNLLRGLLVSWGESLWLITCYKHHIALFSLYGFFLGVSHIKFLMRQYQHKVMSYRPFFLTGVFGGRYWDIRCIVLFSLCEFSFEVSHIKFLMRQCQHKVICLSSSFPHQGFWKMIFDAYWPYCQSVSRLRLWVYLKGSNNINDCILWCFSLFFPLGFKEVCLIYQYYFGFFHRVFQRFIKMHNRQTVKTIRS